MKKVCICGHFGLGEYLLNGQTVKTKILSEELERRFGKENILKLDTHGRVKALLKLPLCTLKAMKTCKNIVILPAHNGLQIIAPIVSFEKLFFKRSLHYVVIGGWLPEFLMRKRWLARLLRRFDGIYVETNIMKETLEKMNFQNIVVLPNCKNLQILEESELIYPTAEPYKLCTFSRIIKEKGIEEAVNAVKAINEQFGRVIYTLDIYGQVDNKQIEWFDALKDTFPKEIRFTGAVSYNMSVAILKNYFALLFPTYYAGEGFAGTLLDAFSAGVPVLASNWKFNAEIIREGINGKLFEPQNMEDLQQQLLWIYSHIEHWNSMKIPCLQIAKKYQPETVITGLTERLR